MNAFIFCVELKTGPILYGYVGQIGVEKKVKQILEDQFGKDMIKKLEFKPLKNQALQYHNFNEEKSINPLPEISKKRTRKTS